MERAAAVTVAVVGTGSAGMRHLAALRHVPGARPIAVPARSERRSRLQAEGFLTAAILEEAVRMGATRCIVASGTARHVPDGLAAAEQGLDLLVEKPLAPNAAAAEPLCQAVRERGRALFVGCVLRFSDSLGTARRLLAEVGPLHAVRIECHSYLPDWRPQRPYRESYSARRDEGGVLRDLIHEIDYAGWLFGWPAAVQARLRNLGRLGIESDELAELMWDAPSGGVVSVCLDYLSSPTRRRMQAYGAHGTLEWDGVAGTVTVERSGTPADVRRSAQTRDQMLLEQDLAFLKACAGGANGNLATGEDGVRALAVCDAARRASASGREERVVYETAASASSVSRVPA